MSKVYDEYQRRMAMAMALLNAAEIDPKAVAQVAIGSLAVAQVGDDEFLASLTGLVEAAAQLQEKWEAEAEAAQNDCNCKACQLRKAAQGGAVVVEEASAEEAAELLAAFGEGS